MALLRLAWAVGASTSMAARHFRVMSHAIIMNRNPEQAATLLALIDRLCAELRPEPRKATLDSSLDRDLELDSLAMVELLLRVERKFAVRLPEHTLSSAETVRDLLQAILAAGPATRDRPQLAPLPQETSGTPPEELATLPDVLDWH